jgi:hypothetical protein
VPSESGERGCQSVHGAARRPHGRERKLCESDGADQSWRRQYSGRSIINDRAVVPEAQEHVPVTENIRALRAALNTLGDGFVEAIDDSTLTDIAGKQPELSEGRIRGEAIQVPVLEAPGQTRVGRFGWKDQHSSLLSFIGDAYLNEMGVTSRLRPKDLFAAWHRDRRRHRAGRPEGYGEQTADGGAVGSAHETTIHARPAINWECACLF